MATLLYRLGRFSYRARRLVVLLWVMVLTLVGVGAATLSAPPVTSFSLPGTESQEAMDLLEERFPGVPMDGGTARVVFEVPDGAQVTEEPYRQQVTAVLDEVAEGGQVAQVTGPDAGGLVSADGSTAVAEVTYEVPFAEINEESREELLSIAGDDRGDLRVEVGGDAAEAMPEVGSELVGLLVAAVVLVLTLGSLVAAGMPLVTGITGVLLGVLGITALTGVVDLAATTPILALMLGLAVGIDYALFIVSRYRHELATGHDPEEAVGRAIGTAGSAVVFAGLTVMIALAGLAVVGVGLLTEMGLAAAATVGVTVLVAITLLPALLGFAGRRVLPRRDRRRDPEAISDNDGKLGSRWIGAVTRRPLTALVLAAVGLGLIALPATDLRLGLPGQGTYPEHTTQRQAHDLVAERFGPGLNGPLIVVVDAADAAQPETAVTAVHERLTSSARTVAASPPQLNEAGSTAIIGVVPTTGPDSEETERLVAEIRDEVREVAGQHGAAIAVTGTTALNIDFTERMADALWTYLIVVMGLSLLLLTAVFRSLVVPLKAAAGFLLSVGATFGALVAVFQWGWLDAVGVSETGSVVSLLPIFIIGVVFGLAMDYQVFLVTRMREEYVHGATPVQAVRVGFQHGARVVAAAAVIMISVFGGFILGDATDIVQIGLALAVAVAVDAFVVRMTIVPAVLALVGHRAWWLPRWLDRLIPNLDIEGENLRQRLEPAPAPVAAEKIGV